MPDLYLKSTNQHLGRITDEEFKFLQEQLEEESQEDDDYTISRMTLDYMKSQNISPNLLTLLETTLGEADEVEIKFKKS